MGADIQLEDREQWVCYGGGLWPSWETGDEFGSETAVRNPREKQWAPVEPAELERKSNGYVWESVRNHGPWWRWDASLRTFTSDWRGGSVGKNNWSLSMRDWVWMPCAHIKSQAWLCTLKLWGRGVLNPESLLHSQKQINNKKKPQQASRLLSHDNKAENGRGHSMSFSSLLMCSTHPHTCKHKPHKPHIHIPNFLYMETSIPHEASGNSIYHKISD